METPKMIVKHAQSKILINKEESVSCRPLMKWATTFVKAFLAKQISCYFASKSVILDKRQGGLFSGICNNIRRIRRKITDNRLQAVF